ncbi:hypothetical protein HY449_00945 [Candidatus Pacearchaeota archaeon]|nr:hypothetical protein [Candidatus Pacearchaeota archaeon]
MKLPHFYSDEKDAEILQKALSNIPHKNIEGLATVSRQKNGIVIKLRIKCGQDIEKIIPESYNIIRRDCEGIFFESGEFKYLCFHSGV